MKTFGIYCKRSNWKGKLDDILGNVWYESEFFLGTPRESTLSKNAIFVQHFSLEKRE